MKKLIACKLLILTLLIVVFNNSYAQATNMWAKKAERDLIFIHDYLLENHPGAVDKENPKFNEWLTKGYEIGLQQLTQVNSYSSWVFLLNAYIGGFNDRYLQLLELYPTKLVGKNPEVFKVNDIKIPDPYTFPFKNQSGAINWPGFFITKQNQKFVIKGSEISKIPNGWEVIHCDDRQISDIIKNIADIHGGGYSFEYPYRLAPLALIDFQIPQTPQFNVCKIKDNQGQISSINLTYSPIEFRDLNSKIIEVSVGKRQLGLQKLPNNIKWLTIPSFNIDSDKYEIYNSLINQLSQYRDSKAIVIDVRGNRGGNSQNWQNLLNTLFTEEYLNFFLNQHPEISTNNVVAEWRVTRDNLNSINKLLDRLQKQYGKESRLVQEYKFVSEAISTELSKTNPRDLIEVDFIASKLEKNHKEKFNHEAKNPVKAKIYVLTDFWCSATTLSFLDTILKLPNVEQVGIVTAADTTYTDIRVKALPSEILYLTLTKKLYRNSPRHIKVTPYYPKKEFEGDIHDDQKVQSWLVNIIDTEQKEDNTLE